MKQKAYAAAGVDIDLGNKVKATLPLLLASTRRREVLGSVGGFGGLFALDTRKFRQPVLVSSADGVGTKLKIAFAMNRHDTVGQDLVNHCVNDIAVLGAEPLFFLDYIGAGKLRPGVFAQLITGPANTISAARLSAWWKRGAFPTTRASGPATRSLGWRPAACTPTAIRWRGRSFSGG
jgi:phosphoribosylformylglycinamidine cyclo-ligase